MRLFTLLLLAFLAGPPVSAQNLDSSLGPLRVEAMATGLTEPWGLAFLPDGGFLRHVQLLPARKGEAESRVGALQLTELAAELAVGAGD